MNSTKARLAEIHGNMKTAQASWFNAIWMGGFHGFYIVLPMEHPQILVWCSPVTIDGTTHWELTITRAPSQLRFAG